MGKARRAREDARRGQSLTLDEAAGIAMRVSGVISDDDLRETEQMMDQRVRRFDAIERGYAEQWAALNERLLCVGGDVVVSPMEPEIDLDELVGDDVRAWLGPASQVVAGDANSCHVNAAILWLSGRATSIGTGYALSDDGRWRQHSWGLDGDRVIETTVDRVVYVGVQRAQVDAMRFTMAHVDAADVAALLADPSVRRRVVPLIEAVHASMIDDLAAGRCRH